MQKILVVDDSAAVHEMLEQLFGTVGLSAEFVSSGKEALARYRQGDIHVVLTDVRMDKMDGLQLLGKLKELDPFAVVLLMTALDRKDDILNALKLGAFDFFVKPFRVHEFTQSLQRAIAERSRRLVLWQQGQQAKAAATGVAPAPQAAPAEVDPDVLKKFEAQKQALHVREQDLLLREGDVDAHEQHLAELDAAAKEREATVTQREVEAQATEKRLEGRETEIAQREAAVEEQLMALDGLGTGGASLEMGGGGDPAAAAEHEAMLAEREAFIEQSENQLFEKGQTLQELETELEHRREQIEAQEKALAEGSAVMSSQASAEDLAEIQKLKDEIEARARDLAQREQELRVRQKQVAKTEALVRAREEYLKRSESILFQEVDD